MTDGQAIFIGFAIFSGVIQLMLIAIRLGRVADALERERKDGAA